MVLCFAGLSFLKRTRMIATRYAPGWSTWHPSILWRVKWRPTKTPKTSRQEKKHLIANMVISYTSPAKYKCVYIILYNIVLELYIYIEIWKKNVMPQLPCRMLGQDALPFQYHPSPPPSLLWCIWRSPLDDLGSPYRQPGVCQRGGGATSMYQWWVDLNQELSWQQKSEWKAYERHIKFMRNMGLFFIHEWNHSKSTTTYMSVHVRKWRGFSTSKNF